MSTKKTVTNIALSEVEKLFHLTISFVEKLWMLGLEEQKLTADQEVLRVLRDMQVTKFPISNK